MKKQTAVEFAFEELNKWRIENFGDDALIGIPQEVLDKAKEMEKEQIELAFFEGKNDGAFMERYSDYKHITPNEYYNETFKSE